jgi:two-component system, NtrC family, sensor kinase
MWRRRKNSLTLRLTGTLIIALTLLLGFTALIQVNLQKRFAEEWARINGLSLSEALSGALHSHMLANDRAGLHTSVRLITERSPGLRIRIFNKEGDITFSSTAREIGTRLDPQSEACYKCHAADRPMERLPPGDRTRSFSVDGVPALGIIKPIENEPSCSSAACHAHSPQRRLLGVLDVTQTLSAGERARRQTALLLVASIAGVLLLSTLVVVWVVSRAVHRPIRDLAATLATLGEGEYSARYTRDDIAEFTHLGSALNRMAQELERANAKIVEWAQTLERRVEEKTAELRRAQEQMLRVDRMASLGKLAAVVAHEINNPLASVVTYSKLLLRRIDKLPAEARDGETRDVLEAIAHESARCGEIVSSLLLFARRTGSQLEPTDVNQVVNKVLFLIKHKMDLAQVKAELALAGDLVPLVCDPAQLEQVLLALCINAVEAMPDGGALGISTRLVEGGLRLEIADTGIGMSEEVRAHIFEPFFTTKGESKGLGLGLAVVYGIVQKFEGSIEVESAVGRGSRFTLTFPLTIRREAS